MNWDAGWLVDCNQVISLCDDLQIAKCMAGEGSNKPLQQSNESVAEREEPNLHRQIKYRRFMAVYEVTHAMIIVEGSVSFG